MATQYSISELADTLAAAAFAINQRIQANFASLSTQEISDLNAQSRELLLTARTLQELETIKIADSVEPSLQSLIAASAEIESAIKSIKQVQKVIDITAKLLSLSSSLIAGNVKDIPGNIEELIKIL